MSKIVLVTGASSGIGKDIAQTLYKSGYIVYAVARRQDQMQDLKELGINIEKLDITSEKNIEEVVNLIVKKHGRIDVLINNAGYGFYHSLEETSLEEGRRQFDVNIFGLMSLTKKVIPFMRKNASGTIINISSVAGKVAMPFMGWYSASKHALEALSDSLRLELSPFGINVVVIEPGRIRSEFASTAFASLDELDSSPYKSALAKFAEFSKKYVIPPAKPNVISKIVLKILNTDSPKNRYLPTIDSCFAVWSKRILGDRILDFFISRKLNS
ncbi:MAG: oxidoreductase [Brevinemataceae bacterium]